MHTKDINVNSNTTEQDIYTANILRRGGGRVNKEENDIDILNDDNANDKSIGIHEEIFQIIKE